jgi:hypothetical protein
MEDTAASRDKSRAGTIVAGRYRIERLIARGGMAAVYLARQIGLERQVALKLLSPPPEGEEGAAFEERFRLEASTLASLDHPNVVVVHDFGTTDDGVAFLAMEYVDGPRLTDLLKPGPLPVDRTLDLVQQVCRGLRYAHKKGVVHRDLKPSNLLVKGTDEGDGRDAPGGSLVKIVDFGLVKLAESDQAITRTGLVMGSPPLHVARAGAGRRHRPAHRRVRGRRAAVPLHHRPLPVPRRPQHGHHDGAPARAGALPVGHGGAAWCCRTASRRWSSAACRSAPPTRFADMTELLTALARVAGAPGREHDHDPRRWPRARCGRSSRRRRGGWCRWSRWRRWRSWRWRPRARWGLWAWSRSSCGRLGLGVARTGEGTPAPAPDLVTVPAPPGPVVVADPPPPAPVPTPSPEVAPTGTATSDDPAPAPRPRPRPAPAADVAPAPAPVAPAPTPAPAPVPEDDAPSGYLGLPDDL